MKILDPSAQDIKELIAFLAWLNKKIPAITEWRGGRDEATGMYEIPWPEYDEHVTALFEVASRECCCDREYVNKKAIEMLHDHELIKHASIDQIKTMLTYCTRGERFCSGHWSSMIEQGHIRRLFERLQVILHEQN